MNYEWDETGIEKKEKTGISWQWQTIRIHPPQIRAPWDSASTESPSQGEVRLWDHLPSFFPICKKWQYMIYVYQISLIMYSIFWIFLAFAWLPCSKLAPLTSFRVAWHARKTWSHPNSVKDVGSWCDFVLDLSVVLDDEKYLLLVWEYRYVPVYSKNASRHKEIYIYMIIYDVIFSSIQRWLLISRGGVRCKQNKNEAIMRYRVMGKKHGKDTDRTKPNLPAKLRNNMTSDFAQVILDSMYRLESMKVPHFAGVKCPRWYHMPQVAISWTK